MLSLRACDEGLPFARENIVLPRRSVDARRLSSNSLFLSLLSSNSLFLSLRRGPRTSSFVSCRQRWVSRLIFKLSPTACEVCGHAELGLVSCGQLGVTRKDQFFTSICLSSPRVFTLPLHETLCCLSAGISDADWFVRAKRERDRHHLPFVSTRHSFVPHLSSLDIR